MKDHRPKDLEDFEKIESPDEQNKYLLEIMKRDNDISEKNLKIFLAQKNLTLEAFFFSDFTDNDFQENFYYYSQVSKEKMPEKSEIKNALLYDIKENLLMYKVLNKMQDDIKRMELIQINRVKVDFYLYNHYNMTGDEVRFYAAHYQLFQDEDIKDHFEKNNNINEEIGG